MREKRPFAVPVSRRIRRVMADRGMSSADLMRKTGFSSGQISNYLNGHQVMRMDKFTAICRALHCSADELLGLKEE